MLEGFVVPHAHFRVFRVFPGDARGQLALLFAPRGVAPTDLHVRAFAQLEAQVKALQQQPAPAHPTVSLVGAAQAAPLAECLAFYARLFTPESFTSPDFLAIVFAKLAEHFVASDSDLVRRTVLEVFRGARAHIAQVGDASKIVTLLRGLLGQPLSQLWALQLVETMPSLVKDEASVRASLLASLKSTEAKEKRSAVDAVRALLPFSKPLRKAVLTEVLTTNSAAIVELTPLTIEEGDLAAAQQAWNFCASLFHEQVSDEGALGCLRAAADIAAKVQDTIITQHLKLIRYVISNDPRPIVVANVWNTCEDVLRALKDGPVTEDFFGIATAQLEQVEGFDSAVGGALRALCVVSENQGPPPAELTKLIRTLSFKSRRYRHQILRVLAQWTRWILTQRSNESLVQHESEGPLDLVKELTRFLSPVHYMRDRTLWHSAIKYVEGLVLDFEDLIADAIGQCYIDLIRLVRHKQVLDMEAALWISFSHISVHCPTVIANASNILDFDAVAALDSKGKRAIAVSLVTASGVRGGDIPGEWQQLCHQLVEDSPETYYDIARVAMYNGVTIFATNHLKSIIKEIEHENFGSWLRALLSVSEAESMVRSEKMISMDALDKLLSGESFLRAVEGFDFQVAYVQARLAWMELMLQAQQYAAEVAHANLEGRVRERRLSEAFAANATQWMALRGKLLCATPGDRDILYHYARLSALLANAVVNLLVLDSTKRDLFRIPIVAPSVSSPVSRALSSLEAEILSKSKRLHTLDSTTRPLVGSTIFGQLLQTICTLPPTLPRQFFRSQARSDREIRCNMQFLTQAEETSYSSKPRTRSQLGVAAGSEFTSSLHGAFVFPKGSLLPKTVNDALIKIFLVCDKVEPSGSNGLTQIVQETTVSLPRMSSPRVLPTGDFLYVPVTIPVVVASDKLQGKGTYTIEATATLIAGNGEEWEVASTGSRRGIIVY